MSNSETGKVLQLDTTGLLCPLPVLKIQKTIKGMEPGDLLLVLADDPVAAIDIPNYCRESGNKLVKQEENTCNRFLIQKV